MSKRSRIFACPANSGFRLPPAIVGGVVVSIPPMTGAGRFFLAVCMVLFLKSHGVVRDAFQNAENRSRLQSQQIDWEMFADFLPTPFLPDVTAKKSVVVTICALPLQKTWMSQVCAWISDGQAVLSFFRPWFPSPARFQV